MFSNKNANVTWILSIFITFVFVQSLPYKFTSHPHTQLIFTKIGDWMNTTIFSFAGDAFAAYGGVLIGLVELVVGIWLIVATATEVMSANKEEPKKILRLIPAFIAMIIMTGAIFFHLFTPLGVNPTGVVNGDVVQVGPALFILACLTWLSALVLILREKEVITKF